MSSVYYKGSQYVLRGFHIILYNFCGYNLIKHFIILFYYCSHGTNKHLFVCLLVHLFVTLSLKIFFLEPKHAGSKLIATECV